MANHKKASHHHGKAGAALEKGDLKMAAHHMGHALAALRSSVAKAEEDVIPSGDQSDISDDGIPDGGYETKGSPAALRARLQRFKK